MFTEIQLNRLPSLPPRGKEQKPFSPDKGGKRKWVKSLINWKYLLPKY
jgi:hypothetical protein